jgi:hypothetical protein
VHAVAAGFSALLVSSAALAQQSPYYVGAGLALGHDTNVRRAPKGSISEEPDKFWNVFALLGLDQPIGRHRLFADATIRRYEFEDLTDLNHTAYVANAGVDWSAADKLSGTFRLGAQSSRSTATIGTTVVGGKANLETAQEVLARVQYGGTGLLTLEGDVTHRSVDYSSALFNSLENRYDAVHAGMLYRVSGALSVGFGARVTDGTYPRVAVLGGLGADDFNRRDIELTARWTPSGASVVNARLSSANQENKAVTSRDFNGVTGSVTWDWQPSGRTRLNTRLSRDTGLETTFLSLGSASTTSLGDASRLTTTLQVGAIWEATGKIQVDAMARFADRSLVNTVPGGATIDEDDRATMLSLGATYKPTRATQLTCQVSHEKRSTSGLLLTFPYSARVLFCSGQIVLR